MYSKLTHSDILTNVDKIFADSGVHQDSVSTLLIRTIASTVDLANYNIEQASDSKNSYRSSINYAEQMTYDISRPTPANCNIGIKVTIRDKKLFDPTLRYRIEIPKFTEFSYDGRMYVTTDTIVSEINGIDFMNGAIYLDMNRSNYFSDRIRLFQGEFRIVEYLPNERVGKLFQRYYIDDSTFSNLYGDKDLSDGNFTMIGIGVDHIRAFENQYQIIRNSLLNADYIRETQYQQTLEPKKVCIIKTSPETPNGHGVEIQFGDGNVVSNGINDTEHKLFIKYFSTDGYSANINGVIGDTVSIVDNRNVLSSTFKFEAYLTSNITGGSDIESVDSIHYNAPFAYQSGNRCVDNTDFEIALKSLSAPINFKSAIVWGEQEELDSVSYFSPNDSDVSYRSIFQLFNCNLYTGIGSMYDLKNNEVQQDFTKITLDSDFKADEVATHSYMNILCKGNVTAVLKHYNIANIAMQTQNRNLLYQTVKSPILTDTMYQSFDIFKTMVRCIRAENTPSKVLPLKIKISFKDTISENEEKFEKEIVINETDMLDFFNDNYWARWFYDNSFGSVTRLNLNDVESFTSWERFISMVECQINKMISNVYDNTGLITNHLLIDSNLDIDDRYVYLMKNAENDAEYKRFKSGQNSTSLYFTGKLFNKGMTDFNISVSFLTEDTIGKFYTPDGNDFSDADKQYFKDIFLLSKMVYGESVTIKNQVGYNFSTDVITVNEYLKKRSMITTRPIYVSPIIQKFNVVGSIVINGLSNKNEVKDAIQKQFYAWADQTVTFNSDVRISNIINLVNSNSEVVHSTLKLVPSTFQKLNKTNFEMRLFAEGKLYKIFDMIAEADKVTVINAVLGALVTFARFHGISGVQTDSVIENGNIAIRYIGYDDMVFSYYEKKFSTNINERTFMYEIAKPIINTLDTVKYRLESGIDTTIPITQTTAFYKVISDIHQDFSYLIRNNMINADGDIAKMSSVKSIPSIGLEFLTDEQGLGGYSLKNEIVQLDFKAEVIYR